MSDELRTEGTNPAGPAPRGDDPDGVRIVATNPSGRRNQRLFQGVALFLVAACAWYLLMPRQVSQARPDDTVRTEGRREAVAVVPEGVPQPAPQGVAAAESIDGTAPAIAGGAAPGIATANRRLTPRRMAKKPTEKVPDDEDPSQQPEFVGITREVTAGEYIQALHDAGIYEGIGAFNPPGTSPPLEGLAVPEDYPLPEGYVRHFQTTDDGQDIEPILMYHPDFEFFDANGNRVPIPEDRVVPPDQAPDGFPIRPIQIPKPREREPGDTGR